MLVEIRDTEFINPDYIVHCSITKMGDGLFDITIILTHGPQVLIKKFESPKHATQWLENKKLLKGN